MHSPGISIRGSRGEAQILDDFECETVEIVIVSLGR
jgi:hypothetical protein